MRTKSFEKKGIKDVKGPTWKNGVAINIAYHAKSGSLFCIDPRNRLATLIKLPKHLHKDLQINSSINMRRNKPEFDGHLSPYACLFLMSSLQFLQQKKKAPSAFSMFCVQNKVEGVFLLDTTKYVLKQTSKQPQQPSHPHEPEELESLDSEESEPESKLERKLSWHHRTHLFDKSLELLFLAFFCFFSFFSNFLAAYHHNCATLFFRKSEGFKSAHLCVRSEVTSTQF